MAGSAGALAAQHAGSSGSSSHVVGEKGGATEVSASPAPISFSASSSTSFPHLILEGRSNGALVDKAERPGGGTEQPSEATGRISQGSRPQDTTGAVFSRTLQVSQGLPGEVQASSSSFQPSSDGLGAVPIEGGGAASVRLGDREGEQASACTSTVGVGGLSGLEVGGTHEDFSSPRTGQVFLASGKRKDSKEEEDNVLPSSASFHPSEPSSSATEPSTSPSSSAPSFSALSSSFPESARPPSSSSPLPSSPPVSSAHAVGNNSAGVPGLGLPDSSERRNGASSGRDEPWVLVQGVSPLVGNTQGSSAASKGTRVPHTPVNPASPEETLPSVSSVSSVRQRESAPAASVTPQSKSAGSSASSSLPSALPSSSVTSSDCYSRAAPASQPASTSPPPPPASSALPGSSSLSSSLEGRRPPSASTAAAASVLAAAAMEAAAAAGRPQRDESATEQVQDFDDDDEFEEGKKKVLQW